MRQHRAHPTIQPVRRVTWIAQRASINEPLAAKPAGPVPSRGRVGTARLIPLLGLLSLGSMSCSLGTVGVPVEPEDQVNRIEPPLGREATPPAGLDMPATTGRTWIPHKYFNFEMEQISMDEPVLSFGNTSFHDSLGARSPTVYYDERCRQCPNPTACPDSCQYRPNTASAVIPRGPFFLYYECSESFYNPSFEALETSGWAAFNTELTRSAKVKKFQAHALQMNHPPVEDCGDNWTECSSGAYTSSYHYTYNNKAYTYPGGIGVVPSQSYRFSIHVKSNAAPSGVPARAKITQYSGMPFPPPTYAYDDSVIITESHCTITSDDQWRRIDCPFQTTSHTKEVAVSLLVKNTRDTDTTTWWDGAQLEITRAGQTNASEFPTAPDMFNQTMIQTIGWGICMATSANGLGWHKHGLLSLDEAISGDWNSFDSWETRKEDFDYHNNYRRKPCTETDLSKCPDDPNCDDACGDIYKAEGNDSWGALFQFNDQYYLHYLHASLWGGGLEQYRYRTPGTPYEQGLAVCDGPLGPCHRCDSNDPTNFHPDCERPDPGADAGPVLTCGPENSWDDEYAVGPRPYEIDGEYYHLYSGRFHEDTNSLNFGISRKADPINGRWPNHDRETAPYFTNNSMRVLEGPHLFRDRITDDQGETVYDFFYVFPDLYAGSPTCDADHHSLPDCLRNGPAGLWVARKHWLTEPETFGGPFDWRAHGDAFPSPWLIDFPLCTDLQTCTGESSDRWDSGVGMQAPVWVPDTRELLVYYPSPGLDTRFLPEWGAVYHMFQSIGLYKIHLPRGDVDRGQSLPIERFEGEAIPGWELTHLKDGNGFTAWSTPAMVSATTPTALTAVLDNTEPKLVTAVTLVPRTNPHAGFPIQFQVQTRNPHAEPTTWVTRFRQTRDLCTEATRYCGRAILLPFAEPVWASEVRIQTQELRLDGATGPGKPTDYHLQLAEVMVWGGCDHDATPPELVTPTPGQTLPPLPAGTTQHDISIGFDEPVLGVNENSVTCEGGCQVAVTAGDEASYTLTVNGLSDGHTYTVQLGSDISDPCHNHLTPTHFTLSVNQDCEPVRPTVVDYYRSQAGDSPEGIDLPADTETETIQIRFSEAVENVDANLSMEGGARIAGVSGSDDTFTIHLADLSNGFGYRLHAQWGIVDRCGNHLIPYTVPVFVRAPGPSSAFLRRDPTDGHDIYHICHGQCCWGFDVVAGEWENHYPEALSSTWSGLSPVMVDGIPTYPWTHGGPTAHWRIGDLATSCNNGHCWIFDQGSTPPQWIDPLPIDLSTTWDELWPAPDGTQPWSHGGPTSSFQLGDDADALTFICNNAWCWVWAGDEQGNWSQLGPEDISSNWRGLVQPADNGILPWTAGGPSASWEVGDAIAIANGPFIWVWDEVSEAFSAPVDIRDLWPLQPDPTGACRDVLPWSNWP